MTTYHRGAPSGHEPRAVQKALALLEAVAQLGPGATAKDIAALTRIAPATAYRLLNLLVADGYLVRIEDLSGFALGRRTRELAAAAEPDPPADNDRVLAELRAQVRFGIHLASFHGGRIRLVDKDPDHELSGEQTLTTHLHASAIGKLLLARDPNLAGPLRRVTASTITPGAALLEELHRVRNADLATEVDECRVGRSSLAVPVRTGTGRAVGALAAIGRTGRFAVTDGDLIDLLRATATRIRL
ncbi:IclR family transcriptional regulator [Nocardia mexicana]|uniref:IclR family transcriptional regulator n=1 Tax=Nocardia mexicana TaxID=279262 RepID=A0A370GHZ1_9NOCA|nr:IclR family transcriptional regulator C-terminal domain-containing protein [Nocardia mexicana]RDI41533.1 IclR family transcriptional regulator [Nocardia mexicana]